MSVFGEALDRAIKDGEDPILAGAFATGFRPEDSASAAVWRQYARFLERQQPVLVFRYRNWRGEVSTRQVRPIIFWRGKTKWHPEEQVFLKAYDIERDEERDFAVKDIG